MEYPLKVTLVDGSTQEITYSDFLSREAKYYGEYYFIDRRYCMTRLVWKYKPPLKAHAAQQCLIIGSFAVMTVVNIDPLVTSVERMPPRHVYTKWSGQYIWTPFCGWDMDGCNLGPWLPFWRRQWYCSFPCLSYILLWKWSPLPVLLVCVIVAVIGRWLTMLSVVLVHLKIPHYVYEVTWQYFL